MATGSKYQIKLQNCAFYAHHGVLSEETRMGQRFFVDAVLQVETEADIAEDQIEGTVHYGEAFAVIERLVTKQTRKLIEALASDIAKGLRAEFPAISHASITVRKPSAPIEGILDYVEVTVCDPQ
ncbi:dihydroneopterin aldolase [Ahrensia sp. R2A130]|uniref:dihydroneopterin aldolase n=1 Tax=Ahrensia sp. R2A130 TaxID=744979 RepID=UPI0001E0F065|nr:dihydroneopterin aldolase [Ahrensia sp. R2A130]EFL90415.1 dihydroneopterin aldolase [Ahrensia sp. R2A130]